MGRKSKSRSIPNEEELLSYIEGELSYGDEQALLKRLESQDKALLGLQNLRDDKLMLSTIEDPDPPVDLLDDCLAAVERSILVSDDPIAPVIELPRYRKNTWHRYAVAASFFILITFGGAWILNSVVFSPNPTEFANHEDTASDPGSNEIEMLATNSESSVSSDNLPSVTDNDGEVADDSLLAANVAARVNPTTGDEAFDDDADARERAIRIAQLPPVADHTPMITEYVPSVRSVDEEIGSTDPGLGVRLAALDRDAALDRLNELIDDGRNVALIYNTPLRDTIPHVNEFEDSEIFNLTAAGDGGSAKPIVRPSNPAGNDDEPELIESDLLIVPLDLQHAYRDEGFEYTLVGTPSQLHSILKDINNDARNLWSVRVMSRDLKNQDSVTSLADLLPPSRPVGKDWSRAIFWWTDPDRNRPIAARVVAAFEVESVIRIPIRIARK